MSSERSFSAVTLPILFVRLSRRSDAISGPLGRSRRRRSGCVFFFSSRRRHTRFDCDWSSDVCSSDLLYGNDIATFPDYPAEIRAPAGTIPGVSGFQLHFSSNEVYTPGDAIDVLIAMNPAALKVNVADLKANGILIVNSDSFKENDLRKAQMTSNPLEDHSLDKFRLFSVELERLTRRSLEHLGLDAKSMDRCKNF